MARKNKAPQDDLLDWFTVSYQTIYGAIAILVLVGIGVGYYYYQRSQPPAVLSTGPAPATSTTTHFTSLEGSVKVKPVGTFEWINADRSMTLKQSDLVRTGSGATAEITFFDGTVVHVRPDSLITIEETSEDPSTKRRRVAWRISSGEVNFQTVGHNVPGSATEVSTPTVRATAGENSNAAIRVAEDGDSNVRVFGGRLTGETKAGQPIEISSNEAVRVDSGGRAGPKLILPGVPSLITPAHQAEISYIDPAKATTLLAWKPVPGAVSYHLMLDPNAYFNQPWLDRREIRESSQELRGLDVGKYYWRVSAIDKNGVEGNFSNFAKFAVVKATTTAVSDAPPPVVVIDSLEVRVNILQVKGRTEPGASVMINGQRAEVQSDGSFNEFITLEKTGRQLVQIRVTSINGGVAEQRRAVVVGD